MNNIDIINQRRRILLGAIKVKSLIIFLNGLLQGSVTSSSSYSGITSGLINVKGHTTSSEGTRSQSFAYSAWSSATEVEMYLIGLGRQNVSVVDTGNDYRATWTVTTYTGHSGSISIGSYDFTKYKTLNFTITNYSGSGTVSFGGVSQNITSDGVYSIDIENYQGNYSITFSCDESSGYSVNNIYLEG